MKRNIESLLRPYVKNMDKEVTVINVLGEPTAFIKLANTKTEIMVQNIVSDKNIQVYYEFDTAIKPNKKVPYVSGLTHLYEHCMFHNLDINGKIVKQVDMWELCAKHNIDLNAWTSYDRITIRMEIKPQEMVNDIIGNSYEQYGQLRHLIKKTDNTDIKTAMKIIDAVAFKHNITKETFEQEKGIVQSEILGRDTNVDNVIREDMFNLLFEEYNSHVGYVEDIDKIEYEHILEADKVLQTRLRSIMVVGDLDNLNPEIFDIIMKQVIKSIRHSDTLKEDKTVDLSLINKKCYFKSFPEPILEIHNSNHPDTNILKVLSTIPLCTKDNLSRTDKVKETIKTFIYIKILLNLLVEDITSMFNKKFRSELGWIYGAYTWYNFAHNDTKFRMAISLAFNQNVKIDNEKAKEIRNIIAEFKLTKTEFNNAISAIENQTKNRIGKYELSLNHYTVSESFVGLNRKDIETIHNYDLSTIDYQDFKTFFNDYIYNLSYFFFQGENSK